ncbi:ASCH domain-containing protein [Cupriavidus alkaliphilus]|uniref:ASCH domain-containing protein n=1 Tax=Cupriavidus alkaliphilus TaxID=942866 RepID=UPI00160D0857|nr:ASCH domain-containing protein [Cupriavidus alkaliphilus]MBB3012042.1 hypothetical protein [Cupriavidus alkaliphilus]
MTLTRPLPTKALSIRQRWAWLIVHGHKDIENRTWPTHFRGSALIHASKGMTLAEHRAVQDYMAEISMGYLKVPASEDLEQGGIIGVAELTACVPPERRTSRWHMDGCHGFAPRAAQPLRFTPMAGRLGFFDVPADVLANCLERA